jgi:hypothetical protein
MLHPGLVWPVVAMLMIYLPMPDRLLSSGNADRRPHTALGGRTPAAAYWSGRKTEQPDWQAKSVA